MTLYDLRTYVNQQVDDSYLASEIAIWYNLGTANYNLIPPVTLYPIISTDEDAAFVDLPINDDNFLLAVMLPFIVSYVKGQEASLSEKQLAMQEFMMNARTFKSSANIPLDYLKDKNNVELSLYQVGENAYLTDFNQNPFAGDWQKASAYKEVVITTKNDGTIVKYVDDSLVEEDIENG